MMRNVLLIIVVFVLLCTSSVQIYATGDPNADTGGGSISDAIEKGSYWKHGDDGVRITVVDAKTGMKKTNSIDWSNSLWGDGNRKAVFYFGKKDKIQYRSSPTLNLVTNGYQSFLAPKGLPEMIGENSPPSREAIVSYFTDETVVRDIASDVSMEYDELISGKYKLLIEPTEYFYYHSNLYAATATEGAIYSSKNAELIRLLGNLTVKNGPLGLFLQKPDLGFPAYVGPTSPSGVLPTATCIAELGLGIVDFTPKCCDWHDEKNCTCMNQLDELGRCTCFQKDDHGEIPCKPDDPACDCVPKETPPPPANNAEFVIREDELTRSFTKVPDWGTGSNFVCEEPQLEECDPNGNCSKKHLTDYEWGEITVPVETFWDSRIFQNKPMDYFKLVRTPDNQNFQYRYNLNQTFQTPYPDGIYKRQLTKVDWMSSRTGINETRTGEVELAQYMNGTDENKAYLEFAETVYGTPEMSYKNPKGNYNAGSMETKTVHGGDATQKVTLYYCDGSSKKTDWSGKITESKIDFEVSAEEIYQAKAKANNTGKYRMVTSTDGGKAGSYVDMMAPSQTIEFYPTYQMKYTDTLSTADPTEEVWMLAKGERKYTATDLIRAEAYQTDTKIYAPWSRDKEDREAGYPIIKSGMATKMTSDDTLVRLDAYFHVQDPNFDPDAAAKNEAKFAEIQGLLQLMADRLAGESGYGYYTNLWEGTTSYLPEGLKVKKASWAKSESPKTEYQLSKKTPVDSRTLVRESFYVDTDGEKQYPGDQSITLGGMNFPCKGRWDDRYADNLLHSTNTLKPLIEEGKGIQKMGWYNESYEGILVVHWKIEIRCEQLQTDYAQVHSQMSDWKTARNRLVPSLFWNGTSSANLLIKGYKFGEDARCGTGLCANFGDLPWGEKTFEDVCVVYRPKLFGLRGSVYDLT